MVRCQSPALTLGGLALAPHAILNFAKGLAFCTNPYGPLHTLLTPTTVGIVACATVLCPAVDPKVVPHLLQHFPRLHADRIAVKCDAEGWALSAHDKVVPLPDNKGVKYGLG